MVSRDEIILEYLDRLPYAPYPVQEEAMYRLGGVRGGHAAVGSDGDRQDAGRRGGGV